jgi:SAM-dependent methyltransferase
MDTKAPEHDEVGESTLATIAAADAFNRWMYDSIKHYCTEPILEIGSGLGNISGFFIADGKQIMLSDLRQEYCTALSGKFLSAKNLIDIAPIDLVAPNFEETYRAHIGTFQSVVALNVVEHIENDSLAMQNFKKLLTENGKLVILVPAYQWLFSRFDTELGHYRRYTKKRLTTLFEKNGFTVQEAKYFNSVGIAGWWLFGKILKKKQIREGQMKLYNLLVPVIKLIDFCTMRSFGLSVIAVGIPQ